MADRFLISLLISDQDIETVRKAIAKHNGAAEVDNHIYARIENLGSDSTNNVDQVRLVLCHAHSSEEARTYLTQVVDALLQTIHATKYDEVVISNENARRLAGVALNVSAVSVKEQIAQPAAMSAPSDLPPTLAATTEPAPVAAGRISKSVLAAPHTDDNAPVSQPGAQSGTDSVVPPQIRLIRKPPSVPPPVSDARTAYVSLFPEVTPLEAAAPPSTVTNGIDPAKISKSGSGAGDTKRVLDFAAKLATQSLGTPTPVKIEGNKDPFDPNKPIVAAARRLVENIQRESRQAARLAVFERIRRGETVVGLTGCGASITLGILGHWGPAVAAFTIPVAAEISSRFTSKTISKIRDNMRLPNGEPGPFYQL
jgi:hypothetical protein